MITNYLLTETPTLLLIVAIGFALSICYEVMIEMSLHPRDQGKQDYKVLRFIMILIVGVIIYSLKTLLN